jgi:hypothetical protein
MNNEVLCADSGLMFLPKWDAPNSIKYLFVNTTSKKDDLSCIIRPGAGVPSFITQESTICYRRARELDSAQLERLIAPNREVPIGIFSQEIVDQIIDGAFRSQKLKNKYKQIIKDWGY